MHVTPGENSSYTISWRGTSHPSLFLAAAADARSRVGHRDAPIPPACRIQGLPTVGFVTASSRGGAVAAPGRVMARTPPRSNSPAPLYRSLLITPTDPPIRPRAPIPPQLGTKPSDLSLECKAVALNYTRLHPPNTTFSAFSYTSGTLYHAVCALQPGTRYYYKARMRSDGSDSCSPVCGAMQWAAVLDELLCVL